MSRRRGAAVLYGADGRVVSDLRAAAAATMIGNMFGGGGFAGARSDRRALADWKYAAGSADNVTIPDLPTLRARSQDLLRNEPLAVGAQATTANDVIGAGLQVHPSIDRDFLGLTEEQAVAWQAQVERIWEAWAASTGADLADRLDFYTIQAVVDRAEFSDGDCFVIRRYVPRPGDVLALKLQLIEADRVSNPLFRPDTDRMAGGVELDEDGRVVQFHVSNRNPWDGYSLAGPRWTPVPAYGAETGERLVLQQYDPIRLGQTRGVPKLAPVIEMLKQLGVYTNAELMATVISSFFTAFVKTEAGEGLGDLGAVSETTRTTMPTPKAGEYRLGSGAIVDLLPGEDVTIANPSRPNPQFDAFVLALCRQIGVALDIPFERLVKQFNASYSASRAALLEAWRSVLTRRQRRVRQLCQPVYEWVVAEAVARGLLSAPGFFDNALVRYAYCRSSWTGPSMGQLNPLDEVNAAKERMNQTLTTHAEETAQLTGTSWERKFPQAVKERRMLEAAGLTGELVAERIATEPIQPTPAKPDPTQRAVDAPGTGPGEDPATQPAGRMVGV